MIKKQRMVSTACILVAGMALLFITDEATARAGGGILGLVLWPFILIYSGIFTYIAAKKNKQVKALLRKISGRDPMWDMDQIKTRFEEAYFKVQMAWRDRDQNIAREFLSNRLYAKHKMQTHDIPKRGIRNGMESINLEEVAVVEVLDYRDNSKDAFWTLIKGSMIDNTIVEKTGDVIDGEKKKLSFKELWRFKRASHGWVLDEIDQDVSISDLRGFNHLQ
ncbi:MAG: Tim44-like domain-containing protein [Candidatus Thiodiazotropha sp.]